MTRADSRLSSADYLNSISRDDLFNRFEVTRVADLTGYDQIGVPVYSCARPAAKSISVSGGKSQNRWLSRAGAIAEAAEFHTFENPVGEFHVEPFGGHLDLPTCRNSTWTPEMPIAVESVTHFASDEQVRFPSELIWMTRRVEFPIVFMRSSNGQAVAATFADAFLTGLYEVVERDQVTLRHLAWKKLGVHPPRISIDLSRPHPQRLIGLVEACDSAGLRLYLFACTFDIHIPTFWAILAGDDGPFAGYGTSIYSDLAAERAILEAIQSRAVWLSGARDDIERRDFEANRDRALAQVRQELDPLPTGAFPHNDMPELSVEDEFSLVLHKLSAYRQNIYFKHLDLGDLHAVKTVILGLECPSFLREDLWRPIRFSTLVQAYINAAQSQGLENSGKVRQLKEIFCEMSSSLNPGKSS